MTGRGKLLVSSILLAAVAACDTSGRAPAGGYGYFDPPPPAPFPGVNQPEAISTLPSAGGVQPGAVPGQQGDLVADVTAALDATGSQTGTLPPTAVQPGAVSTQPIGDTGINPNDDSINLNLTGQEQQKREREAAAALRQQQQQQLVIVEPEPVPQTDTSANVVAFARDTSHPVGTKRYNRPAFRDRVQAASTCRRFDSDEEAQRQFLSNGGPNNDRYNIDPDGDGFACDFDPEVYRKLNF